MLEKIQDYLALPKIVWLLFIGVAATHLLATLWDLVPDEKAGDKTTGVVLGKKKVLFLCSLAFLIILFLLKPVNLIVEVYLYFCITSCLIMLIKNSYKITYYLVWAVILGFPLVCLYLLFFNLTFFLNLVKIRF